MMLILSLTLVLCGIPFFLNVLNYDFSSNFSPINTGDELSTDVLLSAVSGTIHHALLEWSAVVIAVMAAIVSFIHYRIKNDVTVPIIGLALLSAGMVDAFHTLAATRIISAAAPNTDFIPFTWALSRSFNAFIMLVAATFSLWLTTHNANQQSRMVHLKLIISAALFCCSISIFAVVWAASSTSLPQTMFPNEIITRPYDVLPLILFLAGAILYWLWFSEKNTALRLALLLSIFPEVITQLHMAFGSTALFDNHFNIAHFLKNIAYGVILFGILIDLVNVREVIANQKKLRLSTAAAQAASANLQAILNSIADAVITINQQGMILAFNQSAVDMFGYQENEVLGKNVNLLMSRKLASKHDGYLSDYLQGGKKKIIGQGRELPAVRKDGAVFPMFLNINEVVTNDGLIFTALIRDITVNNLMDSENKRVLQQAKNSAWRLDFALSAPNIGVWELDLVTGQRSWDQRMYRLYGYKFDQEYLVEDVWKLAVSSDERKAIKEQINNAIFSGSDIQFQHKITLPNKEVRYIEAHAQLMLNSSGEKIRLVGTNRDISEQYELQEIKQQALNMAEESLRLKSEFLASMSHEIRTPMNGVLGMLGLMQQSSLTKQQNHHLQLATSSAQSLLTLINDILDFSKIEAGKLDLEILHFDLRSQLGEFAESMAIKAQEKGLELILDVSKIKCSMVKGDPSRLRQIISNLVGNAIKFTSSGEIVIQAEVKEFNQRLRLICSVIDTGIGIPLNKIDKLFNSFTQVDATTTRKYGGTGLGLAIVKKLCELMSGKIVVTSELNKGSNFKFSIDLERSERSRIVLPRVDIRGREILIVDDNMTNLAVLKGQLEIWGATVTEAHDGFDAINIINKSSDNKFVIAILDMQMPGMDGAALGKTLKENSKTSETKLIMMTSMSQRGDARYFADLGFSAYFPKPATTSDLFDALSIVLDDSEALASSKPIITHHSLQSVQKLVEPEKLPNISRLLIVEDNRINQAVLLGVLDNIGLAADVASNGLEALAMMKSSPEDNPYQLIIMDCQMPELDGYETTKAIRDGETNSRYLNIPIIAMTANAMRGDKEKCIASGMNDYATKPINPEILQSKLCHWLGSRGHKVQPTKEITDFSSQQAEESKIDPDDENCINELSTKLVEQQNEVLVWNRDAFYKRIRNNERIGQQLIELFLEDAPDLKHAMEKAYDEKDFDVLSMAAHKLKGSTKNLGGEKLALTIEKIEQMIKDKQVPELEVINKTLKVDFEEFC